MPVEPAKPLRIFLSYAHADVLSVRKLHRYLREKGFDVWFDKESLVPGHDWQFEIEKGLSHSDVIIICLSQIAVSKEGFVQREFKFALDRALEMPEGRIFLIPVRLQACEVPTRLSRYQWVDLFEREGYQRLLRGLKYCAEQLERAHVDESQPVSNIPDPDASFDASLSAGKDAQGNIILGSNNVINVIHAPQAQDEAAKREKETAEDERQAREKAEAQRIAQEQAEQEHIARAERIAAQEAEKERLAKLKAENERIAHEKHERAQRARAQTWTRLKTPVLLLGALLLIGVGCLATWLVVQAFPARPTPAATLQASATATLTSATLTPAPPTVIPVTLTPSRSLMPTLAAGDVITSPIDGMVLHYVPAGPFIMGNDAYDDEKPTHQVTLDAFWIDETEVTNKKYALCVKDTKCQTHSFENSYNPKYADYPAIYVSWNDATAYCSWAGRKLPSEAQWEKAARGPNGNTYPWGNNAPDKSLLNYNGNVGNLTKVGSYPSGASPYGAQDMAGNADEWVNDWYDEAYYASSPASNPPGPLTGQYRVLRGGSWGNDVDIVRSAFRFLKDPVKWYDSLGFRCALSQ